MLYLPQRGETVLKRSEIQNLFFQWNPRQMAPNTRYIFTLKELWDTERDVVTAFFTTPALYTQETMSPNLFYGMDKPQLLVGKRYAWQVQAKSGNPVFDGTPLEEGGVYKNDGFSEIYHFNFLDNCVVPTFLTAKNLGNKKVEIRWTIAGPPAENYRVQYRKKGSDVDWDSQNSYTKYPNGLNMNKLSLVYIKKLMHGVDKELNK